MNNVWFTSDLHFRHKNIIQYTNRPWTFEEQTEQLISRWNSRVGLMDDVYHLGDFTFASRKQFDETVEIIKSLNGRIHFIKGNHCDDILWRMIEQANLPHVIWIKEYSKIRVDGHPVVLCHFPFTIWDQKHHGAWHLHGHCHGSFQGQGKILDVGIDNHPDHQVFSWEEVKEFMNNRTDVVLDHHDGGR